MKKLFVALMLAGFCGAWAADEDPSKYMISTPDLIKAGNAKFQTLCAACHGATGDGNTPVAASLKPPPRSFLDPKVEWTNGREPAEIYKTIVKGIPGTGMAPMGAALSIKERWAIVHFINSLAGCKDKYTPISKKNLAENLKKVKEIDSAK